MIGDDENHIKSVLEILSIIIPSFLLTLIAINVSSAFTPKNIYYRYVLEFVIIIIPYILMVTICVEYILLINALIITITLATCVYNKTYVNQKSEALKYIINKQHEKKPFITNARATVNIITAVVILAVDFLVFPVRFQKTESFGYSLMDVGVGLYVFTNGIVAPEIRGVENTLRKTFLNVIPLLVLAFLRWYLLQKFNYYVNVYEYGVHWNFFLTLAVTKLLSSLIMIYAGCNRLKCALIGFGIIFLHQTLLYLGLQEFVYSFKLRDNFIQANREGIGSSLGYLGIYFLSVSLGFLLHGKRKRKLLAQLFVSVIVLGLSTYYLDQMFNVSRGLANSTYCIWILFLGTLMSFLYYAMNMFMSNFYKNVKEIIFVPFISEAINYNGLTFFLVANLLTGLVNIVWKTKDIDVFFTVLILTGYMLATTLIVCVLYVKKIKLKL